MGAKKLQQKHSFSARINNVKWFDTHLINSWQKAITMSNKLKTKLKKIYLQQNKPWLLNKA